MRPWMDSLWRPACLGWLAMTLLGCMAGLWPTMLRPAGGYEPAPLPALRAVATAQAAWLLLGWPIALQSRRRRPLAGDESCLRDLLEALGLVISSVPIWIVMAWLSDATTADVLRTGIVVAAVGAVGLAGGRLLARPAWRAGTLLALLLLAFGLPIGWYLSVDFLPGEPADWAWLLSPVSGVWSQALSRGTTWWPAPYWPPLVWLGLAVFGGLLGAYQAGPCRSTTPSGQS